MDGWLPILFLAVILKIPVFAGMYIVWYAVKAEPETEDAPGEGDHGFRRWRREPKTGPRGPRRDPHGGGAAVAEPSSRRPSHSSQRTRHHRGPRHPATRSR
jgi:hypothetical protein